MASSAAAQTAADVQRSGPQAQTPDQPLTTGMLTYSVTLDDASASLRLFPQADRLVLSVDAPIRPVSPAMLAKALQPLLGAVIQDHPEITRYQVLFRDRDGILDRVRQALAISPAWDARRGRPVHGGLHRLLVNTINDDKAIASEITDVFKSQGYKLELIGVGLVTIGPIAGFRGKRLPEDIARMDFVAVKF